MASRKLRLVLALLGFMAMTLGCRGDPTTVMTRLEESRSLLNRLRLDFRQVTDASNRAVMADTDSASWAAARESEQSTQAVEKHAAALLQLLQGLRYAKETGFIEEFQRRFAEYRALDGRIVSLAVENTNLKAQWLAFGAANETATALVSAFAAARPHFPVRHLDRVDLLAAQSTLAVREIQVLFGPHIAERDEASMGRMEKRMAELDARSRATLAELDQLAPAGAKPNLAEALAALRHFKALSDEIVALSRRNTNLLSLDLSLRQKPTLVAGCNTPLEALRAALEKEGPKSTR